jgi:hypothetical protein
MVDKLDKRNDEEITPDDLQVIYEATHGDQTCDKRERLRSYGIDSNKIEFYKTVSEIDFYCDGFPCDISALIITFDSSPTNYFTKEPFIRRPHWNLKIAGPRVPEHCTLSLKACHPKTGRIAQLDIEDIVYVDKDTQDKIYSAQAYKVWWWKWVRETEKIFSIVDLDLTE